MKITYFTFVSVLACSSLFAVEDAKLVAFSYESGRSTGFSGGASSGAELKMGFTAPVPGNVIALINPRVRFDSVKLSGVSVDRNALGSARLNNAMLLGGNVDVSVSLPCGVEFKSVRASYSGEFEADLVVSALGTSIQVQGDAVLTKGKLKAAASHWVGRAGESMMSVTVYGDPSMLLSLEPAKRNSLEQLSTTVSKSDGYKSWFFLAKSSHALLKDEVLEFRLARAVKVVPFKVLLKGD